MDIRRHFEYNPTLDLTAAHIGINKWDWETIDTEDEDKAKDKMREKRFDVLPILNPNGKVDKYFSTREWNKYDKLNLDTIQISNSIYYRLSLGDLIKKFNQERRHFYFLTNQREILGLVSYANLNCQAVYNYLFQVIADLEQSTSYLLKETLDQDEVVLALEKSSDSHQNDVANNFKKSQEAGRDNSIFEHMYLQTIGIILKKFAPKIPEKFKVLTDNNHKFLRDGIYTELRNKVMHPVRPILNDNDTVSKIDQLLTDYSDIKEVLR